MNPMTNVKNIQKLNERMLDMGVADSVSWHKQYKDSAYVFIGGLPYDLTEGDILCVFSQYGEIVNVNLVRDKKTGKQKGFCFLCYEDQRSTILAVDNFNGIKLGGRTIRVDHCSNYRRPKGDEKDDEGNRKDIIEEGCAPKTPSPSPPPSDDEEPAPKKTKKGKKSKKHKKHKGRKSKEKEIDSASESEEEGRMKKGNVATGESRDRGEVRDWERLRDSNKRDEARENVNVREWDRDKPMSHKRDHQRYEDIDRRDNRRDDRDSRKRDRHDERDKDCDTQETRTDDSMRDRSRLEDRDWDRDKRAGRSGVRDDRERSDRDKRSRDVVRDDRNDERDRRDRDSRGVRTEKRDPGLRDTRQDNYERRDEKRSSRADNRDYESNKR